LDIANAPGFNNEASSIAGTHLVLDFECSMCRGWY
jgi:hypothetical protein